MQSKNYGRSVVLKKQQQQKRLVVRSEGFCQRGKRRSLHVEGLNTEKARELTVESLVQENWRLRVSAAKQGVWERVIRCA